MSGRMRVALVSMHTSPLAPPGSGDAGGMNVYLEALAGPLVAQGLEVDLLTRRTDADQPAAQQLAGGAILRHLDAGPAGRVAKHALADYADEFTAAVGDLGHYDVVHSHYWLSGIAGLAVARASGAPHVLSLHTVAALKNARLPPGDTPEPDSRIDAECDLVSASRLTIAATAAEAAAIRRFYTADPEQVAVVPPGVDRELFAPTGPRADWLPLEQSAATGGNGYLLMAARTQPLKGQDVAIRALGAMDPARRPPLVLVGDASPGHHAYRAQLQVLVQALGLEDLVVFLPAQSRRRLAQLLRGAALLLVPSRSETFGLVTLEAAACCVPSVVSSVPGLTDAVADGISGVHVVAGGRDGGVGPADGAAAHLDDDGAAAHPDDDGADEAFDPDLWAGVITGLLADPERLTALGVSARRYTERYDWTATAARIAAHYRRLTGEG